MKLVPSLPPLNASANGMERLSLFNPSDLLWRYPTINFHPASPLPHPHSPAHPPLDFKTHLPAALGGDPRLWSRDDVVSFLRWAEFEFDLPAFDLDMFQMNGKALCLLTKGDLNERTPGSGDVLHNVLQMLVRDSRLGPGSPLTPHFPLTPSWMAHAPTLEFPPATPPASAPPALNSVTLSPAPSTDSQAGSPPHHPHPSLYPSPASGTPTSAQHNNSYNGSVQNGGSSGSGSGSNQSDSEVEESPRPPATPTHPMNRSPPPHSPAPISAKSMGHAFFPVEPISEPNTNGRLLWDFLQQLLNDSLQRYTAYIAWKNRDLGVFKIVDPPGLAKLWGIQKNHLSMNYDKMSRALRYYYRVNILRKVQGERHCYQFLRNPSELKSIKNISLLRQQMSGSAEHHQQQQVCIKTEPAEVVEDDRPTDLSMASANHFRLTADFDRYLRNPSELKIMKNLHALREQRAAQQVDTQPRDLSVGSGSGSSCSGGSGNGSVQLSLNVEAEQLSRPQDLSHPHHSPLYSHPLIKTEDYDRS